MSASIATLALLPPPATNTMSSRANSPANNRPLSDLARADGIPLALVPAPTTVDTGRANDLGGLNLPVADPRAQRARATQTIIPVGVPSPLVDGANAVEAASLIVRIQASQMDAEGFWHADWLEELIRFMDAQVVRDLPDVCR